MTKLALLVLILSVLIVSLALLTDARPFEREEAPRNMPWFLKALYYMDLYHPSY